MNPILYANQTEADAIANNLKGVLIRKLDKQPPEGYRFNSITIPYGKNAYFTAKLTLDEIFNTPEDKQFYSKLRYPSGTYRVFAPTAMSCVRKWKGYAQESYNKMVPMATDWEVDVVMSVKRVQELTLTDLNNTHIYDFGISFTSWWNALYVKPVKVGDHYECYLYNHNDFFDIYHGDKRWDGWYEIYTDQYRDMRWKGLPLIIHANPFIEINAYERRAV